MIKVKTVDNAIAFLVSLFITYPAIALIAAMLIYSYVPNNPQGIKSIPTEIYSWIESQKRDTAPDGYLNFAKCLDVPNPSKMPKEIQPCQNWTNEAVSINDASNMAINAVVMLYMGLVVAGAFIMVSVKLACGGFKTMLTPMYELLREVVLTVVNLLRRKPR